MAAPRGGSPWRRRRPGAAAVRRHRRHPCAVDAARAGRRPARSREVWWLHGARNSSGAPVRRRGPRPARPAAQRPGRDLLQRAAARPTSWDADYTHRGRLAADVPRHAAGAGRSARLRLRAAGVHGRTCTPHCTHLGLDPAHVRTEVFGAGPAITPGIAAGPVTPPHPPAGEPGHRSRRSPSRAAASPCRGGRTSSASSSSPRPATCRPAGHAGPVSATPARSACSPGRWPTTRRRSTCRPTATSWCAVRRRAKTRSSIYSLRRPAVVG